ncbi:HAMP domain-containing histidine kinase [Clostridium aciditolerans]|uniref:histidine kinase n=2 Tax=Clostridium aciditolerans TaxID=339861 RepID=A0A934HZW8_9CLOT|nr:HAMP domain-containing histidine kinase [Clostridium aciditolerans]
MDLKGKRSLRSIFIRYILYFILGTALLLFLDMMTFSLMLNSKIVLPANYFEQKIESSRDTILKADIVTKDMIPEGCSYGVYNESGKMLYGNFNSKASQNAWNTIQGNQNSSGRNHYYKVFHRDKQTCIVEYSLTAQFSHPLLRKYFMNPELFIGILFICLFIGEVLLLSARFGRYFSKEMKILMKATEQIKKQNLDFQPEHSDIREIEEVINSLNQMKSALKDSLEKQWNMEKSRKNQISALAHDIKTPLTIIKGNAELIKETCQDAEQVKYNDYILKSADEIQHYLKMLIDMIKSEDTLVLRPVRIETKVFFQKLVDQEKALASEKNLELINEQDKIPEFFYGDEELLYRAIMNVITNAVEYSPKKGKLLFKVQGTEKSLKFLIADSGNGFSKEELEFATEQFYRGDKSRNSKNHYGIGLSIAKSFIKLHQGEIELSNSTKMGGAQVVLKIPLDARI